MSAGGCEERTIVPATGPRPAFRQAWNKRRRGRPERGSPATTPIFGQHAPSRGGLRVDHPFGQAGPRQALSPARVAPGRAERVSPGASKRFSGWRRVDAFADRIKGPR